jgi:hypothetical protein
MLPAIMVFLVPIVAIVMGVGIGMLTLVLNHRKRTEMFALYHQERMAAIEKGIDLPPLPEAFFTENGQGRAPHRHLLIGLILLFVGLGVGVALYFKGDDGFLFGLVPAGIGLAFLIYYFAVSRKEAAALEAAAKAKSIQTSRPPMP